MFAGGLSPLFKITKRGKVGYLLGSNHYAPLRCFDITLKHILLSRSCISVEWAGCGNYAYPAYFSFPAFHCMMVNRGIDVALECHYNDIGKPVYSLDKPVTVPNHLLLYFQLAHLKNICIHGMPYYEKGILTYLHTDVHAAHARFLRIPSIIRNNAELFAKRHAVWMDKIATLQEKHDDYLIVIGNAHLFGGLGILNLLHEYGNELTCYHVCKGVFVPIEETLMQ